MPELDESALEYGVMNLKLLMDVTRFVDVKITLTLGPYLMQPYHPTIIRLISNVANHTNALINYC